MMIEDNVLGVRSGKCSVMTVLVLERHAHILTSQTCSYMYVHWSRV